MQSLSSMSSAFVAILVGTLVPGLGARHDMRAHVQSFVDHAEKGQNGVCVGIATECANLYGDTKCADFPGMAMCDTFFDSCQQICERSGVAYYDPSCSCAQESLGCDDFSCKSVIKCNGTPECSSYDNNIDCALTRGCTWTTESPTFSPSESPFLYVAAEEYVVNSTDTNSTGLLGEDSFFLSSFSKSLRNGGLSDKDAAVILDETLQEEVSSSSSFRRRDLGWLLISISAVFYYQ